MQYRFATAICIKVKDAIASHGNFYHIVSMNKQDLEVLTYWLSSQTGQGSSSWKSTSTSYWPVKIHHFPFQSVSSPKLPAVSGGTKEGRAPEETCTTKTSHSASANLGNPKSGSWEKSRERQTSPKISVIATMWLSIYSIKALFFAEYDIDVFFG